MCKILSWWFHDNLQGEWDECLNPLYLDNNDVDDGDGDDDDNDDNADGDYGVVVMTMVLMDDCSSKQYW